MVGGQQRRGGTCWQVKCTAGLPGQMLATASRLPGSPSLALQTELEKSRDTVSTRVFFQEHFKVDKLVHSKHGRYAYSLCKYLCDLPVIFTSLG